MQEVAAEKLVCQMQRFYLQVIYKRQHFIYKSHAKWKDLSRQKLDSIHILYIYIKIIFWFKQTKLLLQRINFEVYSLYVCIDRQTDRTSVK